MDSNSLSMANNHKLDMGKHNMDKSHLEIMGSLIKEDMLNKHSNNTNNHSNSNSNRHSNLRQQLLLTHSMIYSE